MAIESTGEAIESTGEESESADEDSESTGEESESTGEESWREKSFRKVCEEVITNGKRPPVSEARVVMTVGEIELVGLASFGGVRSR